MAMRCNIAVVVITHDEMKLVRAIQSLVDQKVRPHSVWLHDNGTSKSEALDQIEKSQQLLSQAGISYVFSRSDENLRVGTVRARIFHHVRASKADLVTCLDGDDRLGEDVLAAMQTTYLGCGGKVEVIVPREIALRYDSDESRNETITCHIPRMSTARPSASAREIQKWVDLTCVGATFGIRVRALSLLEGFSSGHADDEWVWLVTVWACQEARFAYSDISAKNSYQYQQHDCALTENPHVNRRQDHGERRFFTAKRALQSKPRKWGHLLRAA